MCPGQARHGHLLRPHLLQPPREARVPHFSEHWRVPSRHVPGAPSLLCSPSPSKLSSDYRMFNITLTDCDLPGVAGPGVRV